ncbi:MAG TPA: biopolymer transporter ExbD [Phycisphaerales bacterium]|jgi:biopolymer transport protein ExbD|nr:biopolymer transporter ExbD [Phycisphaerales bacterium]
MRLRRSLTSPPAVEAVNATPLIDVVMCLIMFFLIVGKLSSENGPLVKLPETGVGQDEQSAQIMIITVSVAGPDVAKTGFGAHGISVYTEGETMDTPKELENAVRAKLAAHPAASLQIRGERSLPWGSLDPVLRAAAFGGAKSVRLATERTQ